MKIILHDIQIFFTIDHFSSQGLTTVSLSYSDGLIQQIPPTFLGNYKPQAFNLKYYLVNLLRVSWYILWQIWCLRHYSGVNVFLADSCRWYDVWLAFWQGTKTKWFLFMSLLKISFHLFKVQIEYYLLTKKNHFCKSIFCIGKTKQDTKVPKLQQHFSVV